MRYKLLIGTDLIISEIGFGAFAIGGNKTANSYGPTDDATSIKAIHKALDLGCNFFDTADVYGYGRSELLLGSALATADCSTSVVIAGKVGGNFTSGKTVMDFSRNYITTALDSTLKRLKRDYLDLYQLHDPPLDILQQGEAFETMAELKKSGKIRNIGVSIHTLEEGMAAMASNRVQTLQFHYNLFSLLDPALSLEPLFEPATSSRIGIIAREPLAAGFLSGRHTIDTVYGEGDNRDKWPKGRKLLFIALTNALRRLERPDVTLAQAALRFVLDEPAISTTIVGMKTPAQVIENLGAAEVPSFEELELESATIQ